MKGHEDHQLAILVVESRTWAVLGDEDGDYIVDDRSEDVDTEEFVLCTTCQEREPLPIDRGWQFA